MRLSGLVVAIPTRGTVDARVLNALSAVAHPCGAFPQFVAGFPRDWNRNYIVHSFLGTTGAEWLFWIDDDTLLPPDALEKLAAVGKPFVVGVQPLHIQGVVAVNVAYDLPERGLPVEWGSWYSWDRAREPHRVKACGLGCALIHRSIFERIGHPWFVEDYGDVEGRDNMTEDIYFCRRVHEIGEEIWVVPSLACGHLKTVDIAEWVPLHQVLNKPGDAAMAEGG